jgi:hypothetical protein
MMPCREFYLKGFDNDDHHLFQFDAIEVEITNPLYPRNEKDFLPVMTTQAKCRRCSVSMHPDFIREHAHLHLAVELAKAS